MEGRAGRIILVDVNDEAREVLAKRLRAQGYVVDEAPDAATGADMALSSPPAAFIADLWMPSISGVQLCRLLRSEPATMNVPVILRGERDDPRSRFWAERAGAKAFVPKGRMGELVRALVRALSEAKPDEDDSFFFQLSAESVDIRDRIARHLDSALFDSVIAAEVRALASAGSFERLFDLFAQFLSQVCSYRWLAIATPNPERFAVHYHPKVGAIAEQEAREALGLSATIAPVRIEDEDAAGDAVGTAPIVRTIPFGNDVVGKIAVGPRVESSDANGLVALVAGELGGALRMTALIEESQRMASTDALTGLMNRRAFMSAMSIELSRVQRHSHSLALLLFDVDHFKLINDRRGHASGDLVLASLGALVRDSLRKYDLAARWGGEEFVIALVMANEDGGRVVAERMRRAIESLPIRDGSGDLIPVTASIGLAEFRPGDTIDSLIDRADRAMYASKAGGRNRVTVADAPAKAAVERPSDSPKTGQLRRPSDIAPRGADVRSNAADGTELREVCS